jgi:hypothetical protein
MKVLQEPGSVKLLIASLGYERTSRGAIADTARAFSIRWGAGEKECNQGRTLITTTGHSSSWRTLEHGRGDCQSAKVCRLISADALHPCRLRGAALRKPCRPLKRTRCIALWLPRHSRAGLSCVAAPRLAHRLSHRHAAGASFVPPSLCSIRVS